MSEVAPPAPRPAETRLGHIVTSIQDGVVEVWLDRPPVNVLDRDMVEQLSAAVTALAEEPTLRLLLLRSRGRAFSAGVDVDEHRGESAAPTIRRFHHLLALLEAFPAPTAAVVAGAALGGGLELALACDLRLVAVEARLGLPEIQLGVFPPYGALRLGEVAGRGRAARLVLTGEPVDGAAAFALGVADWAVPRAELDDTARALVAGFRAKSAAALRLAKEALRAGRAVPGERLALIEELYLGPLMGTHDAEEGLLAFVEKRSPRWLHR